MYKFYNELDKLVAKQEILRDFTIDEKYYIDEEIQERTDNINYNSSEALEVYKNQYIRRKRTSLLKETDNLVSISDFTITQDQIDQILQYRQNLRDLTNNVTMENINNVTYPEKPQILIDLGY